MQKRFQTIDSLFNAGKPDTALNLLKNARPDIKSDDPLLSTYYCFIAEHNLTDTVARVLYADSAVSFFCHDARREKYPSEYARALLIKGDVCFAIKEYSTALQNYDNARNVMGSKGDDGVLAGKMANIYFGQGNFEVAARYWTKSFRQLEKSPAGYTPQHLFYLKQGTLDNAGITYERMNKLDSAIYFYNLDHALINAAETDGRINQEQLKNARIVLYDNLGGAYLKQNKLDSATKYLTTAAALPAKDSNGLRISLFLKLARLYQLNGNDKEAAASFEKSYQLLKLYGKTNARAKVFWYKNYAEFMFKQGNAAKAYQYQTEYIRLKDSLDSSFDKLRRVDVEKELNLIDQQNRLERLMQQARIEQLYVTAISIAAVVALVVIIIIARILRQSRKNHREAQERNVSLKITMQELEHANKNITRIMRVMAHDLRTPLSGIIGLASAVNEDKHLSSDNKHMVQLIENTGTRTLDMIDELLRTGLSDEKENIEKKPVDLKILLSDLIELLQFKADEKQLKINFDSTETIVAEVSYEKIWRVFSNIIANAIKFSHRGDTIQVNLSKKPGSKVVVVSVADNGIGIAEKEHNEVFEMFTEAKRVGTDGEKSFGLGLAISKRIVGLHKGRIWFESQPEKGTTFYIELPA
ncbi:ATP-binding protein [Mucilaginibacter calamicampi]|uniref:histidine kinase n=1 Tax=Mucilaginibacter calamicampi TaxID=1302352 RepID=A0ABW2Z393_9SPHI